MIWIRADGGREIGSGHIMRCLSIADALRQLGAQVCFLLADASAVPLLEKREQEYRVLNSSWRQPEKELSHLPEIFGSGEGDVFLADSYYVTAEYLRRVGDHMPVCYMDDRGLKGLPVDLLINYNIFADAALYETTESTGPTAYLLGVEYVPLRREFQGIVYEVKDRVRRVLVTTGGSDPYDLAGQFVKLALAEPGTRHLEYCVVSGAYNEHLPQLRKLEAANENVHVYSNVENMCELMQSCDLAVTAGGSTMYELSAVGVPSVCFSFVDNQEGIVQEFRRRALVCFGGDYLAQGKQMLREAVACASLLAESLERRQYYSARQRSLVDGKGAVRIANRLCGLV